MPKEVMRISKNYMQNPKTIEVASRNEGIDHQYVVVKPIEKLEVLMHFLNTKEGQRGIIFCKTKAAVNKLAKKLAIKTSLLMHFMEI